MFMDTKWFAAWQPVPVLAASTALTRRQLAAKRQDQLLDDALEETFPASDPVSVIRIT